MTAALGNQFRRLARRLEPLVEASENALLGLAILSMALYLLELYGLPDWASRIVTVVTLLIDLTFVLDLAVKIGTQGTVYTDSPWFLIDLLSCLPVFDTVANGLVWPRSLRFVRGLRLLRILRGLRVLRALRTLPAFEQFSHELKGSEKRRTYHRRMNLGLLVLTGTMLITIVGFRRSLEREYLARIDNGLAENLTVGHLRDLGGSLVPPEGPSVLERTATVDNRERTVYFDSRGIDKEVNDFEFFLMLGMIFSMVLFIYLLTFYNLEITRTQLRGLLNLALPRQVADQFVEDPSAYTRKSRMPATVLFMDFVGFTSICESFADDPDTLSMHLEAAMDRLVSELVKHDMIIDKFIGDAVMSFRGGPLVEGSAADHAYRAVWAALDSIRALAELDDPYFKQVKIGGASADDCLIGAFGTSARLSYTILGDGVNLAARLEPASAQCATQNLFSESTYRLCSGHTEIVWRRWGRIRVSGKTEAVTVYEAFDARLLPDDRFVATFHDALALFEHDDVERARSAFLLADSERPGGDPPSRFYARRCDALLSSGLPVGWEPAFEMHK
jgi:class 3 adenylate cyclase